MVFRMEITYSEVEKVLAMKYIPTSSSGYTLSPGVYEKIDIILMLKSLLPVDLTINIAIRLTSNLTTNKTVKLTEKIFFLYIFRLYPITRGSIR